MRGRKLLRRKGGRRHWRRHLEMQSYSSNAKASLDVPEVFIPLKTVRKIQTQSP